MPANTPKGYPYPLGTDRVADGDDAIHSLATAVDTRVGVAAAGSVSLTTPASGQGTVVVAFPVGRFTAAPAVTATLTAGSVLTDGQVTVVSNPSTASVTLGYNRGAANTFTVQWIAIQVA